MNKISGMFLISRHFPNIERITIAVPTVNSTIIWNGKIARPCKVNRDDISSPIH